ncbi:MAG TPA: DUF2752 domain-containing protein [Bryobacteraceae bacterium]|nr:DUF2752 domain-containing protein [Bryobacteraceae bacterium]
MAWKPGAAALVGGLLLIELAAVSALFSADAAGVWFAGTRVGGACFLRERLGVPCPTCGMMRSVILTLHGDLGAAFAANPAGPLWVAAVAAIAAALVAAKRWVRPVALTGGGLFALVAAAHWMYVVAAR